MAGVYISYPFCVQKCTYCNFASGVFPRELEVQYHQALLREFHATDWPWIPDTVYLGGGTPSNWDPAQLAEVLAAIPSGTSECKWQEATMEAAPGNLTQERIRAWMAAGINRVSLGVQSFVQKELARTGRKHTAQIVEREVALLRECGLSNISVDLIAGLPHQTAESWNESLEWALDRLHVPHLSVYMLEVDEDSRLGRELIALGSRYGANDVPNEDCIADFYETAVARAEEAGLERYEISNFAAPGWESLHNLKYWRREPYLGFGADAHSFDGISRWQNAETAAEYVADFRAGRSTRRELMPADPQSEQMFLGLRLREGVPAQLQSDFPEPLSRFLESGLLEQRNGRIVLTARGVLLSNEVFAEFVG